MIRYYSGISVLEAAKKRVRYVFDNFDRVFVSVSSGKDSTVLYHIALQEAISRDVKLNVFFLDQEAEYQASIDMIKEMMNHPNVVPHWYQVECYMTNATSYHAHFLNAWGKGEKWIREKDPASIKEIDGDYPRRFYEFFEWFENQQGNNTAMMVGLRSKESLNRFRAVTKNPGYNNISWSTKTKKESVYRFYPIYDWMFGDVWKFIHENGIKYNPVYNLMYAKLGMKLNEIRISNLIHEKSFRCLADLQEIEPDTYEKLCDRIDGIHSAAIYANEGMIYNSEKLPDKFKTWLEYRDFLVESAPITKSKKDRLRTRFAKQKKTEDVFQQQCKQILLNDWENNIPVDQHRKNKEELYKKWWDVL